MSRITPPLVSLALSLTLLCVTLPGARADVPAAPTKKAAKQEQSCATCSAGPAGQKEDWVNKFATMGQRTQQTPVVPVHRSLFDGMRINMVGTANGSLAFAVTDLKVSGLMPLVFQRVYASDRAEDRGLGAGWSFIYDDRIRMDGDEAVLSTGVGGDIAFRRDGQSSRFVLRTAESGLHQSFEEVSDGTLTESVGRITRTYQRIGGEYRLSRISDPNGNAIAISFDRKGNVSRVEGLGGQSLSLNWTAGKQRQLLSVTDKTGRRVTFARRGKLLDTVIDQAGSRWSYEYAGGRLVGVTDPLGRAVLRARYDAQGRVVESGDAAGSHLFDYEGGGRTTVTDPLGAKTTITHTALGAVSSITEDEGLTATIEYDEANRPTRAYDSVGNVQTFAQEADGKGAASASATGGTVYTYDARGNALTARSGDPATSYRAVRNGRGQPLSLKAESGREMTFEYDAAGNETAFTYSDAGRFEKRFDGAGRKISERLPWGRSFNYEYDAHGQVARATDNSGRALTIERDASGRLKATEADGTRVRITRDEAGRVTRLDASDGKSRQFVYDARGALTYYRDARGRQYSMSYDRSGRLQKVDKSDGVTFHYRYGRNGRVASASREVRGNAPGFVKAGFNLSPPLAAWEMDPTDCILTDDGFGFYYDPCDPDFSYSDPVLIVTAWEYARVGLVPIHRPTQDCLSRAYQACDLEHSACMADAAAIATGLLVGCIFVTKGWTRIGCGILVGVAYLHLVNKCDYNLEACRLRAQNDCNSTG